MNALDRKASEIIHSWACNTREKEYFEVNLKFWDKNVYSRLKKYLNTKNKICPKTVSQLVEYVRSYNTEHVLLFCVLIQQEEELFLQRVITTGIDVQLKNKKIHPIYLMVKNNLDGEQYIKKLTEPISIQTYRFRQIWFPKKIRCCKTIRMTHVIINN